ncbi:tRNA pseudouridine(38-40) synthase TruA [Granulicoccus phenolivorans]|uniref:tRNA pseudouridine(38-40) synthase TruA n=1 Tax=Granulicoccus phenolivorans TaxID=266854 RepID=UPI000404C770|nr:tRNA pseudouridine(38-40) synthase TruA [Granulicoccus phenolivorans]
MTRWRLDIAYDGRDFSGWAAQPGLRTVQGVLEEWIPRVLRLTEPTPLTCAGRTDAGVHARGQVAHLELPADRDPEHLRRRLARVLPDDLVVRAVTVVPDSFDARFAAIWRRYIYRLDDTGAPDPLRRGSVVATRPLDVAAMNEAATTLLGLRDFAPFCKRRDGATTIRTLLDLQAERVPSGLIEFTVRADAFCHSMVRSLMGAMVAVGSGRRDRAWLERTAAAPARAGSVFVMPAHGLCLEEVGYPPAQQWAERSARARSFRDPAELGGQHD